MLDGDAGSILLRARHPLEMKPRPHVQELRKRHDIQRVAHVATGKYLYIVDQLNPPSKLRERHARPFIAHLTRSNSIKDRSDAFLFWRHAVSLIVFAWCNDESAKMREERIESSVKRERQRECFETMSGIIDEKLERKTRNVEGMSRE